jgi:hypothetical protein
MKKLGHWLRAARRRSGVVRAGREHESARIAEELGIIVERRAG